ncbi:MAG: DUF3419 family protein [Opitutaceae bacterium]
MTRDTDREAGPGDILLSQSWEDTDTLLDALGTRPGESVVSVAGSGDHALALLTADPGQVIAVDPNPAQIACGKLKSLAFRTLGHGELLELMGSRASIRRPALLADVLESAPAAEKAFWKAVRRVGSDGIGGIGRFELQLAAFRRRLLPTAAGKAKIDALLTRRDESERARFHDSKWNTHRWRIAYRAAFSRLAAVGDEDAGKKVSLDKGAWDGICLRLRQQLVSQDPSANPYLHWMLRGDHGDALPTLYRARHHAAICERLDRISWRAQSLEGALGTLPAGSVDRFDLGGLFEGTSEAAYQHLLKAILRAARPGARLVYWNTLVNRSRPESLKAQIRPLEDLTTRLNAADKTLFGQRLVIEEVSG